tara:strand:+ start:147 stop:395 length:249 start_codon:yes stop_codon:yes gene_type:complete
MDNFNPDIINSRKEYDKLYYQKRKLQKQTDLKTFFMKNPSQTYTMTRRYNVEKRLRQNEEKANAFRELLKSNQNVYVNTDKA